MLKIKHIRRESIDKEEADSPCELWRARGEAFQTWGRGKILSWLSGEVWRNWGLRARMSSSGESRYFPMTVCCI